MNIDDFGRFFGALWGYKPFPWQSELMKRVAEQGWPTTIDLPTSAGKTATIDMALFHLALEAEKPSKKRLAPVRIIFVIDRRLVVNDAYKRACHIRDVLAQAESGVLADVAQRLATFSGGKPLEVIELLGGLLHEPSFIQNPLQPTIILSTVDQIGSRLLFRGYGISKNERPIHAALVGTDSIIILDEAHFSRPFEETLGWVKHYQSVYWDDEPVSRPVVMVRMTATPSDGIEDVFSLSDADWQDKTLQPRLTCTKLAELVSIGGDKKDPDATRHLLVETFANEAMSLMQKIGGTPVIGIVVNRVATARQVFDRLQTEGDAVLLIGRTRPLDRDEVIKDFLPRMKAGRKDEDNLQPLYVVATQTIEVSADIDFDALVTEAAALDALRQRFGRLNRLGRREHDDAVIVYLNYGRSVEADPIYGSALVETWKWMNGVAKKPHGKKRKTIDFGIQAMNGMLPGNLTSMLTPNKAAPVLMPAHMDLLVQTNPMPADDPEVAPYLHGPDTELEDVQLLWRADLPDNNEAAAIETASTLPPNQLEVLTLPIRAARAFLAGVDQDDISDVEGEGEYNEDTVRNRTSGRYAIRWRGSDDLKVIYDANEVAPGDRLILPSLYGGLDLFGWNPFWNEAAKDIGDEAASKQRGKSVLRIHKNLIPQWLDDQDGVSEAIGWLKETLRRYDDEEEDLSDLCSDLIEKLLGLPLKDEVRERLVKLQSNRNEIVYPHGILLQELAEAKPALIREILLDNHCQGVAELTSISAIGLPAELIAALKLAAKLHDIGKADPRFQLWLYKADRMAMLSANKLLAKSVRPAYWNEVRQYRELAGYPAGARHECYSVAMARNNQILDGTDNYLVLYLIGVHHGRGRPFMPTVDDPGTTIKYELEGRQFNFSGQHHLEQMDSDWPDWFWQFCRQYGYWGLAYLETLIRLADQSQSAQERR